MEIIFIAIGLVINGIIANVIGNLGKDKKIGYSTSFWISFLLTPLLGILIVIASQPLTDSEREEQAKRKDSYDRWEGTLLEKKRTDLTEEEIKSLKTREDSTFVVLGIVVLVFIIYVIIK